MKRESQVHSHIPARKVGQIKMTAQDVRQYAALNDIGINLSDRIIQQMIDGIGMDATDNVGITPAPLSSLSTAAITNPVQFLQNWLPGFVRIMTAARKIDDLIGISTIGSWEDEQIVQGVLEPLGTAQPYSDYGNVPLSSWNMNFNYRTVIRFEQGMLVGLLEEARSARVRIASAAEKRSAAAVALDIQRNRTGFYGWNDGAGLTYGFLNDPSLPNYVTAPATGSGSSTLWSTKTFANLTGDLRVGLTALQIQSYDNIDVQSTPITIAVAMSVYQYLTTTTDFGVSVRDWLTKNYPNVRVVSAPELDAANSSANVIYFYADAIDDGGSDGGATFLQVVPSKFITLGVEKRSKAYIEDYANATAGVMTKRPYAVYRMTGV